MLMNAADQERRLAQLRGNAYGDEYKLTTPSDAVERPSNSIPGLKRKDVERTKHVNFFEELERGEAKGNVEGNVEREKELAMEKKKWEDMVTSKLVNATKDHAPWYSQLDKISGVEKERSQVEKELKAQKQMKWKDDADPLKLMGRYLEKKKEADEREERRREKMDGQLTEREQRRRRGRTPEHGRSDRMHRSEEEERGRKRLRHHISKAQSPKRDHKRHRHHHRSRSSEPDIERLRRERHGREAAERGKVERLLRKGRDEDRYEPVGHGGYSAQFHPEAVRR